MSVSATPAPPPDDHSPRRPQRGQGDQHEQPGASAGEPPQRPGRAPRRARGEHDPTDPPATGTASSTARGPAREPDGRPEPVDPAPTVEPIEPVEPVEPVEVGDRGDAGGSSQASRLVSLAVGEFNLVQGTDGRPYAVERDGASVALPLRASNGQGLRQRLSRRYFTLTGVAPGGSALADALTVIEGLAADADPVPVWLRVARDPCGAIVLDLGDPTGRAVLIRPGAWHLLERSPVLFRRTNLTGTLPIPATTQTTGQTHGHTPGQSTGRPDGHPDRHPDGHPDGRTPGQADRLRPNVSALPSAVPTRLSGLLGLTGLMGLRGLLNVDEEGFRLLVGWLLAALVPDIPHPILALLGEQGTAKSTAARFAVGLIDPSPAPLRTPPRDVRSWAVTAAASWTVALDNLSTVPGWFSDTLCKAVTGDGIIERTLHSDDDVTVLAFRRVIALTSIDAGALAGDLAERLLPVELHPIHPDARRPDADVEAAYRASAPAALGALLDLLAAVLEELPTVHPERLPRMADFARLLAALDVVTGWTTLPDYLDRAAEGQRQVVDADPLAAAVFTLLDGQAVGWTGTPTDLHDALTTTYTAQHGQYGPLPKDWPTARTLTGRLRRIAPALRDHGVTITEQRTMTARLVHLTRTTTDTARTADADPTRADADADAEEVQR